MQPREIEAKPLIKTSNIRAAATSFVLRFDWSRVTKYKQQLAKHKKKHIEYKGLHLPPPETILEQDPHQYFDGKIWRDGVQKQLKFKKLLVDFLNITVVLKEPSVVLQLVYDYNHLETIFPWSEMTRIMSKGGNLTVILLYTLQVIC